MTSPLAQAIAFQNSVNPAQTGIAPTDVVGAYKLASDVAEKNYMAKLAANNAMFGGLAGLGGAGITAFGPTLAKSYFGQGAATAAAPTATSAATGVGDAVAAGLPTSLEAAGTMAPEVAATAAPAAATVGEGLAAAAPEAAAAGGSFLAGLPEWLLPLLALA